MKDGSLLFSCLTALLLLMQVAQRILDDVLFKRMTEVFTRPYNITVYVTVYDVIISTVCHVGNYVKSDSEIVN